MNTLVRRFVKLFLILVILNPAVLAQQAELTLEDAIMGGYTKFRIENLSQLQWRPETDSYTWRKGDSLMIQDASSDEISILLTKEDVNKILAEDEKEQIEFLPSCSWIGQNQLRFRTGKMFFDIGIQENTILKYHKLPEGAGNLDIGESATSYTIGNNLFMRFNNDEDVQITRDEDPGIVNGQTVHRNEFGISKGTFWSP